ncbi:MAG: serine protease [Bacteriovoracaceae bacterium]
MKTLAMVATLCLSFEAISAISTSYFAPLDVNSIHDQELINERKGIAPRFAIPHSVAINPTQDQAWERAENGHVWIHRVQAPNAVSLNFGFTRFHLPKSAELNIYSADRSQYIRSFTYQDNNINGQLWTPVIMSDDVFIELKVDESEINLVDIELGHIGQGFRTFAETTLKAGSCNIDVACTDSKGWEKEINSVAVISTGGSNFCTGFMVNNTKNDKTPFFMTAAHCRITPEAAPTLVTYWNYQTSKCGGTRDGKLTQFNTGSTHLATGKKSDFTLVKLLQSPKPEWKVTYAGWDARGAEGTAAVGIHHPNTDEKSISFENDPTKIASYGGEESPGDGTHVRIVDWDKGTTEPGSSGSPLFDKNHRVIGQLHGGGAACGNDLSDYYGRFYISWKGDGGKGNGLSDHLDAGKTGKMFTDTL